MYFFFLVLFSFVLTVPRESQNNSGPKTRTKWKQTKSTLYFPLTCCALLGIDKMKSPEYDYILNSLPPPSPHPKKKMEREKNWMLFSEIISIPLELGGGGGGGGVEVSYGCSRSPNISCTSDLTIVWRNSTIRDISQLLKSGFVVLAYPHLV